MSKKFGFEEIQRQISKYSGAEEWNRNTIEQAKTDGRISADEHEQLLAHLTSHEETWLEKVKKKIIHGTPTSLNQDGVCIHYFFLRDFQTIWTIGLQGGSAVILGGYNNEGETVTIEDVRRGNRDIFGYDYAQPRGNNRIFEIRTIEDLRFELDGFLYRRRERDGYTNDPYRKYIAVLRLIYNKYKNQSPSTVLSDEDRKIAEKHIDTQYDIWVAAIVVNH